MTGSGRAVLRALGAIAVAGWLAGCEELKPYRTHHAPAARNCNADPAFVVPEHCRASMVESSDDYDLFFTEYTDQGLAYPKGFGEAHDQINHTLEGLKRIASASRGVSVIVFVHGWKHNASHDDANVRDFRALLRSAALFEQARSSGNRVVGVYVGWRGLSIADEPLSNLSFWSRKAAALRVAQGSPRELFNRLRSFKCAQNLNAVRGQLAKGEVGDCDEPAGNGGVRQKVRMIMIGHSFGAAILYNAVAGSLVESITYPRDVGRDAVNSRYADMIVLLNPAFEASQYVPLHRVATAAEYAFYQAPLLVSVTTTADQATKRAFRWGRLINSIFERAANDEEDTAIKRTMGHVDTYITHDLRRAPDQPAECANWRPLRGTADPEERRRQAEVNRKAEEANINRFPGRNRALEANWTRTFCGGARLTHLEHDPNSVIWNVRTDASIMNGHNDISNDALFEFVRQLYHDTVLYPLPAGSNVRRTAAPEQK